MAAKAIVADIDRLMRNPQLRLRPGVLCTLTRSNVRDPSLLGGMRFLIFM